MAAWTRNPLTGHSALAAPQRADRPRPTDDACPFCPGAEAGTPPTTDREPAAGAWTARAFANAYPIVPDHEVVVDSARHLTHFHELEVDEARAAARLWVRRLSAFRARGLSPILFRNEGAGAGASMPHVHAQVVGHADAFPRVQHEAAAFHAACPLEDDAFWASRSQLAGFIVGEPAAARFPGETWILPARHAPRVEDEPSDMWADVLLAVTRGLASSEVEAHNIVLHTAPVGVDAYHWHLEILPRRETLGGFELGAGVFVNPGL